MAAGHGTFPNVIPTIKLPGGHGLNVAPIDLPQNSSTFRAKQHVQFSMMYDDSKNTLKGIVEWLQDSDEAGWEAQIKNGEAVREDLERMARPDYHRGRSRGMVQGTQRDPHAAKLNRAIPHVRAMLTAMMNRNRAAAVEHGRAALAVM